MPKFRDHSLVPTEVVRLAALGLLASGPKSYGDLAVEVRHFSSRMLGPSLDILGTSIEVLRHEGLIEPIGPRTGPSQSLRAETAVQLTEAGRAALHELLTSRVRVPMTDLTRMVVALKLRFLGLLSPDEQRQQFEMLIELTDAELVRLNDLRSASGGPAEALDDFLAHEIAQTRARREWYARRLASIAGESNA